MAERDSECYEFDAPSHVVNLEDLLDSACDDQWFGSSLPAPPLTSMTFPVQIVVYIFVTLSRAEKRTRLDVTPLKAVDLPASGVPDTDTDATVSPRVHEAQESVTGASAPPPNLVASWEEDWTGAGTGPKRGRTNLDPAQPRRVSKRQTAGGSSAPPSKKRKEHGTSEERELQRIQDLQRKVVRDRKKNEASLKAALAGKPPPKKTVLSTTVPKDFHFSTDQRIKTSASCSAAHTEPDFSRQLRKRSSPAKARSGATVPKPFKLSGGAKQKEEPTTFVSMAQQIQRYETRTPPRYHVPSRHAQERGPSPERGEHMKLTQPQSPHLMTLRRNRHPAVKSTAEQEAEEADKLKTFKFKAVELNRKILEGAEPLKKPAVKEPTVPESFELEIERRLQQRQATKKPPQGRGAYNFRARPLPKDVLDGVQGVPEKKPLPPTVPESPAFALKKRVRVERPVEVQPPSPVKVRPLPHAGVPFQPRLPDNISVQVCPFSFEQRERERLMMKEQRQKDQQQDQVVQFKAQPLPDFDAVQLPEKRRVEPTRPEPFKLMVDRRGAVKTSRWEQMVKEEQKLQQEVATFKARPNVVVHQEPFRPRKEERPPLVVQNFHLATEQRARDWEELDQLASERQAQKLHQEATWRQQQEHKEREEVCRLRQEQVHKAQPVRHYKPVSVKKSDVPLTVPESPNFSDRFRL